MEVLKKNGFTLIEILVVLGIMATLLSISFLNLSLIDKIKERDMVRMMVRNLENVRSDAMTNKRDTRFEALNDKTYYSLVRNPEKTNEERERVELSEGWDFLGDAFIDFGNNGLLSSTITIKITNNKGKEIDFTVGVATARILVKEINK